MKQLTWDEMVNLPNGTVFIKQSCSMRWIPGEQNYHYSRCVAGKFFPEEIEKCKNDPSKRGIDVLHELFRVVDFVSEKDNKFFLPDEEYYVNEMRNQYSSYTKEELSYILNGISKLLSEKMR